ncbi:hypothetical protein TNCT_377721 [Trichonephila clavata]|uniref:Uncharacterized protein n=1 Tax=Trichonephila clavata TaxID=2740835 RepID=A0A8X6FEB6_TRICU|nr:hypothetical protein TNCT_377721 [Trichonephila clavata]
MFKRLMYASEYLLMAEYDFDYYTYGTDSRRCRPVSIAVFRVTSTKNHFPTMTASLQLGFSGYVTFLFGE